MANRKKSGKCFTIASNKSWDNSAQASKKDLYNKSFNTLKKAIE